MILANASIVRRFFKIVEDDKISMAVTAAISGVDPQSLSNWKLDKNSPRIDLFESVVNAAGYELVLQKRGTK